MASVSKYNEYGRPLFGVNRNGGLYQMLLNSYTYNESTSVNNFHYFGGANNVGIEGKRIDYQYGDNSYSVDFTGDMSTTGRELQQLLIHMLQKTDEVPSFQIENYMDQQDDVLFKNLQMSSLNITIGTDRVITYSVTGEGVKETGENLINPDKVVDYDVMPIQYWSDGPLINIPIMLVNSDGSEVIPDLKGFKITDFTLNFSNTLPNTSYTSKARIINPNNTMNDVKLTITYEIDSNNINKVYSLRDVVDRTEVSMKLLEGKSSIILGNTISIDYNQEDKIGVVSTVTEDVTGGQVSTFTLETTLSQSKIKDISLV